MSRGVVVVSGASLGVGRAAARAFAARGYDVALLARAAESLAAAAADVDAHGGGRVLAVATDVAVAEAVDRAAEQVERELGPIDVWVNVAMTSVFAPVREYVAEEVRRTTDVTYHGYVYGMLTALARCASRSRRHRQRRFGALLPFHPVAGRLLRRQARDGRLHRLAALRADPRPEPREGVSRAPAGAEHAAVRAGALAAAAAAAARPPIYQPEVAARAIVRAAEHPRREYWVGAPTVAAIIGSRLIPGLLDHYLGRTGFGVSRRASRPTPTAPTTSGSPCRVTSARMAGSTAGRTRGASRPG